MYLDVVGSGECTLKTPRMDNRCMPSIKKRDLFRFIYAREKSRHNQVRLGVLGVYW